MDEKQFHREMERNFQALTRLVNVLRADLFRLETLIGPEGQEILVEIRKVEEALNNQLKNLQKLIRLAKPSLPED
jgi:predicted  nucleic acid-binding Zn-ribbon protein